MYGSQVIDMTRAIFEP